MIRLGTSQVFAFVHEWSLEIEEEEELVAKAGRSNLSTGTNFSSENEIGNGGLLKLTRLPSYANWRVRATFAIAYVTPRKL